MSNNGSINKANYRYQLEKSLQFIRDERERELYGENEPPPLKPSAVKGRLTKKFRRLSWRGLLPP